MTDVGGLEEEEAEAKSRGIGRRIGSTWAESSEESLRKLPKIALDCKLIFSFGMVESGLVKST